jgi:hypothetical protein
VAIARYLVPREINQVQNAFRAIIEVCKRGAIARVTLVVPNKGRWERSIVAESLGAACVKALLKGQSVRVTDGVSMTLKSTQNFRAYSNDGLLVGAHISLKDMNKLDDSPMAQAVMFLPWSEQEDNEWRATWNPEVIGSTTQTPLRHNLSAEVEDALRQLTRQINLSTGLNHPSDAEHARRIIAKLRAEGEERDRSGFLTGNTGSCPKRGSMTS